MGFSCIIYIKQYGKYIACNKWEVYTVQCALKTLVKLIKKNGRILSTIYEIGLHYRVPVKLITKNGRILSTIYEIGLHYRVPVKLITKAGRTLSDKEERLLGSIHPVGTF